MKNTYRGIEVKTISKGNQLYLYVANDLIDVIEYDHVGGLYDMIIECKKSIDDYIILQEEIRKEQEERIIENLDNMAKDRGDKNPYHAYTISLHDVLGCLVPNEYLHITIFDGATEREVYKGIYKNLFLDENFLVKPVKFIECGQRHCLKIILGE